MSIHAPREGGDTYSKGYYMVQAISIHAPREGGDAVSGQPNTKKRNFNPRPPRGGRLGQLRTCKAAVYISIHAPREGGDVGA